MGSEDPKMRPDESVAKRSEAIGFLGVKKGRKMGSEDPKMRPDESVAKHSVASATR